VGEAAGACKIRVGEAAGGYGSRVGEAAGGCAGRVGEAPSLLDVSAPPSLQLSRYRGKIVGLS
jgi:hypothetical protein